MRTIVYVDGFNIFYRALKGTSWKWLDLHLLFRTVLGPYHDIRTIKYFTARVSATPASSWHKQIFHGTYGRMRCEGRNYRIRFRTPTYVNQFFDSLLSAELDDSFESVPDSFQGQVIAACIRTQ